MATGTPVRRLAAAALLLSASGCGTAQDDAATTEPSPSPGTELSISVSLGPGKGERSYSLACDPAGGDHPDPEAACRALAQMEAPFEPVPPDTMCTEIYGGPQRATVTGMFEGEPVRAEFSRTNGCEIARWDDHQALLVVRGGVDR